VTALDAPPGVIAGKLDNQNSIPLSEAGRLVFATMLSTHPVSHLSM
jgi:hypothetical protein